MNLQDMSIKEFDLYLLESNLETLFKCFSDSPSNCLLLVDQLHDIQHDYEEAGEFDKGRAVSEWRNKAFEKGQALQLHENQKAFVGDCKWES